MIRKKKSKGWNREHKGRFFWRAADLHSRLRLPRFLLVAPSPFVALGLMKVVALTVEHQKSADQERRRHKALFFSGSDRSRRNAGMLLRKMRSVRAAGNQPLQVQRRAGLTSSSPSPSVGPSEAACPSISPTGGLAQAAEPSADGAIQPLTAVKAGLLPETPGKAAPPRPDKHQPSAPRLLSPFLLCTGHLNLEPKAKKRRRKHKRGKKEACCQAK